MIKNEYILGLISGSSGAISVYPINLVKTKMQNQNNMIKVEYKNGFDCVKQIINQSGLRGLYRGGFFQMMGVAPEKALKLYTYSWFIKGNEKDWRYHLVGGGLSGFTQSFLACPLEYVVINKQMGKSINFMEKNTYTSMFKGLNPTLWRNVSFSAIYFQIYWDLKDNRGMNAFMAGTLAGVPASVLSTPFDVAKTRIQTLDEKNPLKYKSFLGTMKTVYKEEGFKALWKGSVWRAIRSSPQFGITLFVYEKLKTL